MHLVAGRQRDGCSLSHEGAALPRFDGRPVKLTVSVLISRTILTKNKFGVCWNSQRKQKYEWAFLGHKISRKTKSNFKYVDKQPPKILTP